MKLLLKEITAKTAIPAIIAIAFTVFLIVSFYAQKDYDKLSDFDDLVFSDEGEINLKKFKTEKDFKDYIQSVSRKYGYQDEVFEGRGGRVSPIPTLPSDELLLEGKSVSNDFSRIDRVSQTNVQVLGIDEPDIVKTDGKQIYFSPEALYYFRGPIILDDFSPMEEKSSIWPPPVEAKSLSIKAFPPSDLEVEAKMDRQGSLLLVGDTLVIFSNNNEITGYNVSKPNSPKEEWNLKLEDNNSIVQARLFGDKIYVVTQQYVNQINPCPIPLFKGSQSITIPCAEIYYPTRPVFADITLSAMTISPKDGKVEKTISFVGSSGMSVVYMSKNALYITYQYQESAVKFFSAFLVEEFSDVAPSWLKDKVTKLNSYDISEASKLAELQFLWNQYINSLDDDEKLRVNNELTNRLEGYYKRNLRDLGRTGIAKIDLSTFSIDDIGSVPGQLLNQFALDEHEGNLRVATTVGESFNLWAVGIWGSNQNSENDVYVLDGDLKIMGSVQGLGLTEKIYSARFIEDKGYLVTFRQIDPFYVIDLSNPSKPEMKGELKIPGYSSYLHPINKDFIVGVGQDGSQVKVSLFDVSSATNPKEADKYVLSEYWTDVSNTHHAFLMDQKHEIFFIPGSRGGYIFSYKGNKLGLARVLSNISAKRAIFINDYLYIIGEDKISVLNEADWEKVNELVLR